MKKDIYKILIIIIFVTTTMTLFGQNNNSVKEILTELFLGLPVSEDYNSVISNSKMTFKEEKKYLPLPGMDSNPSSVVNIAETEGGKCFFGLYKKAEIEIEKSIIDTNARSYAVIIRYYFDEKSKIVEAYNLINQKMILYKSLTDSKQIKNKKNKIVEEHSIYKLNEPSEMPFIHLSYDLESTTNNNCLFVMFYSGK